jgi:hypothetical protein
LIREGFEISIFINIDTPRRKAIGRKGKLGFEISQKRRGMSQNEHGTGRESKYYPAADF